MTALQLIFLITGAITLVAALMVVLSGRLVHAALWLILVLACVAVLFVLLNAGFLAVVQVAIYIDAIAILIIIVVMLTQRVMGKGIVQINRGWWMAVLAVLILFTGLLALLKLAPVLSTAQPPLTADAEALLEDLGQSLVDVDRFVLPFEVASILLLAALIGSFVIAWPRNTETEQEGEQ